MFITPNVYFITRISSDILIKVPLNKTIRTVIEFDPQSFTTSQYITLCTNYTHLI